jgi:hypothetical protein
MEGRKYDKKSTEIRYLTCHHELDSHQPARYCYCYHCNKKYEFEYEFDIAYSFRTRPLFVMSG